MDGWSLTSLFGTNTAISETRIKDEYIGKGWLLAYWGPWLPWPSLNLLMPAWQQYIYRGITVSFVCLLCQVAYLLFTELNFINSFHIPVQQFVAYFHALELGYRHKPCTSSFRNISQSHRQIFSRLRLQLLCRMFKFGIHVYNFEIICLSVFTERPLYVTVSSIILFSTEPRDWLRRTSPKWPILCRVWCKTL